MKNIRVWFRKENECKYISHLDLNRCMMRAIKMACLPISYTQGFNPRPAIVFSSALSLGISGIKESVDLKLTDEDIDKESAIRLLNKSLPNGIRVFDITEPKEKASVISFALFYIKVHNNGEESILNEFEGFLSRDEILKEKKSKSGIKVINLKEYIKNLELNEFDDYILIKVVLPAGNTQNINPFLITEAFDEYTNHKHYCEVSRQLLLDSELNEFK